MLRLTIAAVFALGLIGTTLAQDFVSGDLAIGEPWARATAASQGTGAAYLSITNNGDADRIVGAESPIAERVELHSHAMDDAGVMRMRQLDTLDLPAGETVELVPGGLHIMLVDLAAPLAEGETFPLTLVLEDAGPVEIEVEVMPVTHGIGGGTSHGH